MNTDVLLWILAVVLILLGLAGNFLPALPGPPFVFLGLLTAAWIDGFQRVGWGTLAALAGFTAFSFLVEYLAAAAGARRFGAGKDAAVGAALGTLVGLFFGVPGLLLGPFAGAVLGELRAGKNPAQAGRAGVGAWLGLLFGAVAKLALSFAMVGIFIAAYFL